MRDASQEETVLVDAVKIYVDPVGDDSCNDLTKPKYDLPSKEYSDNQVYINKIHDLI